MFAVIFKAKVKKLDKEFFETAERLRKIAFEEYGCLGMKSETKDGIETTISYWPSVEHIKRWKQNPEHLKAQKQASKWYESYEVRIEERK